MAFWDKKVFICGALGCVNTCTFRRYNNCLCEAPEKHECYYKKAARPSKAELIILNNQAQIFQSIQLCDRNVEKLLEEQKTR